MRYIILTLVLLISLSSLGFSQERINDVRLDETKATAYLSFEKSGYRPPKFKGESSNGIWLRFHNNSKWNLTVATIGTDRIYGDYHLFYNLRKQEGHTVNIPELPLNHVSTVRIIEPGKSFIFSLPKEHLADGLILSVEFSYEWEISGNGGGGTGFIKHIIEFPYFKIPIDKKVSKYYSKAGPLANKSHFEDSQRKNIECYDLDYR